MEQQLDQSGVAAKYLLKYRKKAVGGYPDILFNLPGGRQAVIDRTTPKEAGKIPKYAAANVDYLVEVIQPGP